MVFEEVFRPAKYQLIIAIIAGLASVLFWPLILFSGLVIVPLTFLTGYLAVKKLQVGIINACFLSLFNLFLAYITPTAILVFGFLLFYDNIGVGLAALSIFFFLIPAMIIGLVFGLAGALVAKSRFEKGFNKKNKKDLAIGSWFVKTIKTAKFPILVTVVFILVVNVLWFIVGGRFINRSFVILSDFIAIIWTGYFFAKKYKHKILDTGVASAIVFSISYISVVCISLLLLLIMYLASLTGFTFSNGVNSLRPYFSFTLDYVSITAFDVMIFWPAILAGGIVPGAIGWYIANRQKKPLPKKSKKKR